MTGNEKQNNIFIGDGKRIKKVTKIFKSAQHSNSPAH